MTGERKKSGVSLWITVGVVVAVMYVLSFGPAIWVRDHALHPEWTWPVYLNVYAPIIWLHNHGPEPIRNAIHWYAQLGCW